MEGTKIKGDRYLNWERGSLRPGDSRGPSPGPCSSAPTALASGTRSPEGGAAVLAQTGPGRPGPGTRTSKGDRLEHEGHASLQVFACCQAKSLPPKKRVSLPQAPAPQSTTA